MLVSMKTLLQSALKKKYAVPALNVNNMELVQAVFSSANNAKSPVIVQVSPSALEYSDKLIPAMVLEESKRFPKVKFALHLDHGRSFEECKKAISLGFSSVMMDASINYSKKDSHGNHPARKFSDNVRLTKKVAAIAHRKGVSVEGEVGALGGIEDSAKSRVHLADPFEAKEFAEKTGVDALAIAIGTSHGAYKFKSTPKLAFNVLRETRKLVPRIPLVLHGASSVPKPIVQKARKYGLNIGANAKGVPMSQVKKAISLGVCKINIDTDARIAFAAGFLEKAKQDKGSVDLRKYLGAGRSAVEKVYLDKMRAFGSKGKL
ncbi:MAG: class II fructose-bisphosphate aldolase [Candidatus Diapherotrites archaeon]|nr:class II fructose-bisphosphate aldolase [Candidatus Diapherotrites archaeon]